MHILFYQRRSYIDGDTISAIQAAGIQLSTFQYDFKNKNVDNKFLDFFHPLLKEKSPDAVFSINYYPLIAEVCHSSGTKYISWSYDCPLDVFDIENTLGYPTNYAFMFDRIQAQKYTDRGFEQVYHLPLAVNTNRLDSFNNIKEQDVSRYQCDVSFVGNLYPGPYIRLINVLPEYLQGYLDGICESQLHLYGSYFLENIITQELVDDINCIVRENTSKKNFQLIKDQVTFTMASHITRNERIRILSLLGGLSDITTKLFSQEADRIEGVMNCGKAQYSTQMPLVFKHSKINLNISLKCIQSGIPLRALDIMGCGGFLVSNYQHELLEYFEPNVDFIMYENISEIPDLVCYYLQQDKLRNEMSARAYEKIREYFSYPQRINSILEIAGLNQ